MKDNENTQDVDGSGSSDCYPHGVWFQAACSGLWYTNHKAAGTITNVKIDGVLFRGPELPEICEHGVPDGDWCEPCNAEYKHAEAQAAARECG